MKLPATTVRDRLWMWGHEAGSHNECYRLPRSSRMTPAEGAYFLGAPNLLMVRFANRPAPPYDQCALALRPLRRLVWSIVGDSLTTSNDRVSDLDEVLALAQRHPNIIGAIMDDFFLNTPDAAGRIARRSVAQLADIRARLRAAPRPLELWVTLYTHNLRLPLQAHLRQCDLITFWTWKTEDLARREADLERLETLLPGARIALGCYMFDYDRMLPLPLMLMQRQCEQALAWLKAGRIEEIIFLASCVCDLELEAVEWTRAWIEKVGDQPLKIV